ARPAHLYGDRALRSAQLQHVAELDAERHLIHARAHAITGDAEQLRSGAARRAELCEPARPFVEDAGDAAERLDVVDRGGATEVALLGGKRRAVLGITAPAFARAEQG